MVLLCPLCDEGVVQEVLPQRGDDLTGDETVGVDGDQSHQKHSIWSQVVVDEVPANICINQARRKKNRHFDLKN